MVDAIAAAFRGHQLLLLLHPAIHGVIGELGPPSSQGLRRPLGRPLGRPGAVRAVGAAVGLMRPRRRRHSLPRRPVSVLGAVLSQQSGSAEDGLGERVGQRVGPAEGQVDRLLFEHAQLDVAGAASPLLPLSVPGLSGGPTVDVKVVVKEPRQVPEILP